MQLLRASFVTSGVTWTGISFRGLMGSIPMRLGINRMRRSSESDGSQLGEIPAEA